MSRTWSARSRNHWFFTVNNLKKVIINTNISAIFVAARLHNYINPFSAAKMHPHPVSHSQYTCVPTQRQSLIGWCVWCERWIGDTRSNSRCKSLSMSDGVISVRRLFLTTNNKKTAIINTHKLEMFLLMHIYKIIHQHNVLRWRMERKAMGFVFWEVLGVDTGLLPDRKSSCFNSCREWVLRQAFPFMKIGKIASRQKAV